MNITKRNAGFGSSTNTNDTRSKVARLLASRVPLPQQRTTQLCSPSPATQAKQTKQVDQASPPPSQVNDANVMTKGSNNQASEATQALKPERTRKTSSNFLANNLLPYEWLDMPEDENSVVGRTTTQDACAVQGSWTPEEDESLRKAVKKYDAKNWKQIAKLAFSNTRNDVQCLHRWQKVLRPGIIKGRWTPQEDRVITKLIKAYGIYTVRWNEVAQALPGRLGKQCRERWVNHLDPSISKLPWTEEEDLILKEQHMLLGNKWRDIATVLPGRSENAVKNRWNSAVRGNKRRIRRESAKEEKLAASTAVFALSELAQAANARMEEKSKSISNEVPKS